jgi:hypothetical protein
METSNKTTKSTSMTVPLFVPLKAPRITSTSHASLVKWRRERKRYEQQVAERCNGDAAKIAETIVSVKSSFDDNLLSVLCDLEWGVDKDLVTDKELVERLNDVIAAVKNNRVPNVAAEFKEAVKMDMKETDVRDRVVQYFAASRQFIEERGWGDFFTDEKGKELRGRLLANSIEPAMLRDDVKEIMEVQNHAALTDEKELFRLVLKRALIHEDAFQRRKRYNSTSKNDGLDIDALGNDRPSKKARFKQQVSSRYETPKGAIARSARPVKPENTPKTPDGGCLKCKGAHWLVNCPSATSEEKKELLRQRHEKRERDKAGRKAGGHH